METVTEVIVPTDEEKILGANFNTILASNTTRIIGTAVKLMIIIFINKSKTKLIWEKFEIQYEK